MNNPIHPNFFIPETFGDAVSYEVQVKYLHQRLKSLEEEGIPTPDLTELKQRVTTLETEVSAIQGEIEDLDLESITAQFQQINADIEQLQATQSQQGTTLQGYNTRLLELETKTDSQDQAIDALDGRVTGVTTAVSNVAAEQTQMAQDIAGKQDQLTAGANITIQNNVISASGGGGTIDIDTTVTANSQHAVTSEGIYNAIQTAKTAVETQHTTDINRIDGELAGKASTTSVTTLRGDMEDEIERVEGDYQDADTALDTRLTAVETAQTTTEGNVTTLQQNVTTLQQTQTSQGTAIQGIRGRLDTAESNITQLQTTTSTLSGDVSSLQQTVSGKQDQLTAGQNITIQNNVISASGGGSITLDNDVTQNSQNGVKSSGIYTAIQNAKSDLETQDAAIQADLTALTTRVDDVEDDVEQAQTDISTLQTGQQTLSTNLSTETSAREAADQALRIDVNSNTSAINTLRTNTTASITQLQTDVAGKQDTLTAGTNITIENNVISSSGGGGSVIAGMTISELSQAIATSSANSAIKAPDVVKQHGGSGTQRVLLPSDVFTSQIGCPLITLPVREESSHVFKAWPVDMYFEQPNVLTFKDYDNVVVEPTRFYNGSTLYANVDTFSSFAANPFFCPTVQTYIGTKDSTDLSDSTDTDLICYEVPISWRLANINTDNYPANYTYGCINMNKRIMKGYAVYTAGNSGSYPVHCVGVMLVEPLYDTLRIYDKHDLIVMNMKCTRWINLWGGGTLQYKPVAIIPIY